MRPITSYHLITMPFRTAQISRSRRNLKLKQLKRINAELNNLEALAGISQMKSVPTHLEVDFSSKCNLRCTMCHQAKFKMGSFQLKHAEIASLINVLPYVETVMIAGLGEPLLYQHLEHFLPFLSRYGCHAHLFTNGQLIDKYLDALVHVQRISISIDGASKAVFEDLRRGASFSRVMNNVRLLRARAPNSVLVTSTVVSTRNLHEIADIVALAIDLGLDEVHLSPVDHTPELMLTPAHLAEFQAQITRARMLTRRSKTDLHNNITPAHFRVGRNARIAPDDLNSASELNRVSDFLNLSDYERPDSIVSNDSDSVKIPSTPALKLSDRYIQELDTCAELDELERRIAQQSAALNALKTALSEKSEPLRTPYCSAPWKYAFARSTGQARLCPYADINVGAVSDTLSGNYNSMLLKQVRGSLATGQPLLSVCQNCTDDHRNFRADSLAHTQREFGRSALSNQLIRWLRSAKQAARRRGSLRPPWLV